MGYAPVDITQRVVAVAVNDAMLSRDVPIENKNVAMAQPLVTNAVMAAIDANPAVAIVETSSPFLSKVNWTQVIMFILTLLTVVGIDIPPETKLQIVTGFTALGGIVTIIIKTWFTRSISLSSK